jgi:hypothetical protein
VWSRADGNSRAVSLIERKIADQQTIKIRARRESVSEKSGAQIQTVGGRAEQYTQRETAKQDDGLERMNVALGSGNGADGDVRNGIH